KDHAVGCGREHHVGLVDAANAAVDYVDLDLLLGKLRDLVLDRLQRPGHVGLDDERELLDGPLLRELEHVLERDLAPRTARQRLRLQSVGTLAGQLAGAPLVLDHAHDLARLGHAVEAQHLDRLARSRALDARADEVVHGTHAAEVRARHQRIADAQGAALDQHAHDRSPAGVELGLDHGARRGGVPICLQLLEVGDQLNRVQQRASPWRVFALTSTNSISPPHSDGCSPRCVISVRTRSGCAPSLSTLFTATIIGTSAARAWSIASSVCGLTPSSAATTITARSVTRAPRARIAVNASCPGVSRKVISLSPWWTW